jgi:WD40 repeat protein
VASRWSPDGKWLNGAFADGTAAVYSPETGTYTILPNIKQSGPWLHDSRRFFTRSNGVATLVDRLSHRVRTVLSPAPGGEILVAAVSPDDRRLVVWRVSEGADIWLATLK